jgi:ribose transport system permease protein
MNATSETAMGVPRVQLERFSRLISHRGWKDHALVVGLLVALMIANGIAEPELVDVYQAGLLLQTALPLVLIGFAQTLAILLRGFDLSVGATMAVTDVLAATWLGGFDAGVSWHLVVILAIALAIGAINGLLIAVAKLPAFIATLATWSIFNGVAIGLLSRDGGEVPTWMTKLVTGEFLGLPNSYFIVLAALIVWWHLRRGRLGRNIYAVGSDPERAALNGVSVRGVTIATFALCGLAAGVGGLLLAGQTSTGQPTAGDPFILQSVVAVVIGGTSLAGGRGGVGLTLIGVLILTLIGSLIQSLGLEAWVNVLFSSGLLLAIVLIRAVPTLIREART